MERKNNILNKIFSPKLLVIEWSFIVLFCIFIGCSVRASAATDTNTKLPYSCAEYWDYNTALHNNFEVALQWARARYENVDHVPEGYSILVWTTDGIYTDWAGRKGTQYSFMVNPYTTYNYSENMDYSTNTVTLASVYPIYNFYYIDAGTYSSNNGGYSAVLLGNSASVDTEFGVYLPRYPFYYDGEPITDSDGTEIIVSRIEGGVIVTGHATAPDLTGDNIGSDKPDLDDYIPTQPTQPTFDNSSLESMVESLYNWLKWEYNAITSTIKGFINYLGDTITYSIQKVIDNIKNAIKNFYDNMVSLFEPLLNGLAEIGQSIKGTIENIGSLLEAFFAPFDEEQFQEAYNNCEFITAVDGFKDSIEEFEHAFEYAEERDYFTLYLGFIMDGYTVNYDLDFTWLYPLRQYYRPIIWCVVVYEFFVYLCAQLSDYLQGRSGK